MFKQGDIVAVDFPFTDGSSTKKRPAIVVSNDSISATGEVIVLMITSKKSDGAPMVNLVPDLLTRALPKDSFAKCHRIYTIDGKLITAKYSQLTPKGMAQVFEKFLSVIS
jgi:mRNA interferase MazF